MSTRPQKCNENIHFNALFTMSEQDNKREIIKTWKKFKPIQSFPE